MGRVCTLTLNPGGPQQREITAQFDDAQWSLVTQFEGYVQDLDLCRTFPEGSLACNLQIAWEDGVLRYSGEIPDWNKVALALHRLRPFILESEPTYFCKVVNVLQRELDDAVFRNGLKLLKERFLGTVLERAVKLRVNEEVINSDEMFRRYLNAFEFHRDGDKRERLERLFAIFPSDAVRTVFVYMLVEKIKAIYNLWELTGYLAGKYEGQPFNLPVRVQK